VERLRGLEGCQRAPYVAALFDALLIEAAFLILLGSEQVDTGVGVAEKVNDHRGLSFLSYDTAAARSPGRY